MILSLQRFEAWLVAYGGAWSARDARRFADLFESDALYYWTPVEEPKRGRAAIAAAFSAAVGRQRQIEFGARALYTRAQMGVAHWSCDFTRLATGRRVHLDGVCMVQFGESGKALSFREWWHSDER